MRLRSCDVDTVAAFIHGSAGPTPAIAIDGQPFARTALLAETLAQRVPGATFLDAAAYSSDDVPVDLRVWMDDPGGFHADFLTRQARGEQVQGRWVATISAEEEERLAARERAEHRARDRADVVFAAVEGFDSVAHLRFMAETTADFALWDTHNGFLGELESLLPIPGELAARIRRWAVDADLRRTADTDHAGRLLAEELQTVLGTRYRIDYRG
jgi:hypothetical protein